LLVFYALQENQKFIDQSNAAAGGSQENELILANVEDPTKPFWYIMQVLFLVLLLSFFLNN